MEHSHVGSTPFRHPDEEVFSFLAEEASRFSPRSLGALGLGAGALAFGAALLGVRSWIVFGAAFVLWLFSGCCLFFRTERASRLVSISVSFLVLSGTLIALAVLVALYLLALGPSWKL